eukprot:RCo027133
MFSSSAARLVGAALFSKGRHARKAPKSSSAGVAPANPFEGISVFGYKRVVPQDRRDIQELKSLAETPSTDQDLDRILRKQTAHDPNIRVPTQPHVQFGVTPLPSGVVFVEANCRKNNTFLYAYHEDPWTRAQTRLTECYSKGSHVLQMSRKGGKKMIPPASVKAAELVRDQILDKGYHDVVIRIRGFTPSRGPTLNVFSGCPHWTVHEVQDVTPRTCGQRPPHFPRNKGATQRQLRAIRP